MDPFRPAPFDPVLAQAVCRALLGGVTLTRACDHPGMPDRGTVMVWATENPAFETQLNAAKARGAELMLEDLSGRCDGDRLPPERQPQNGAQQLSRDRLAFAATRMLLSLYNPEVFGRIRPPRAPAAPGPAAEPRQPAASTTRLAHAIRAPSTPADTERATFRAEAGDLGIGADAAEALLAIAEAADLFDAEDADAGLIPESAIAARPRPTRRQRRAMAAEARRRPATNPRPFAEPGQRAPPA